MRAGAQAAPAESATSSASNLGMSFGKNGPVFRSGSFQLTDDVWRIGRIEATTTDLFRAKLPTETEVRNYAPSEVRQYVVIPDTFRLVTNIIMLSGPTLNAFVVRQYRDRNFVVYRYRKTIADMGAPIYVLQAGEVKAEVPTNRKAFTAMMLPLVGQCLELAEKLKKSELGPESLKMILATYTRWQQQITPASN